MNRLDEVVRRGVMLGLTAKECAYESGYDAGTLTKRAKRLGMAFKWARVAKIPTHLKVPPETVSRRHRDTVRLMMKGIEDALKGMTELPVQHPSVSILSKTLSLARRRNNLRS